MAKNTLQSYLRRIRKVLRFIEDNLDDELPLKKLAQIACFSEYHFHRIFNGMVGESVKSYVRRLRLERAARQLLGSKSSVTDIACCAGYQTVEAFSKAFLRSFGVAPRNFRHSKSQINLKKQLLIETVGDIKMNIEIKKVPKMRVAYVRHIGPYAECKPAWDKLFHANIKFGPKTQFLGLCYDDPAVTPANKIRYDACITVDDNYKAEGDVDIQDIANGKYAVYLHVGPYTELAGIYNTICGQWLPQNGYEIKSEPSIEIYKNDPNTTEPNKLETEIYIPIKR